MKYAKLKAKKEEVVVVEKISHSDNPAVSLRQSGIRHAWEKIMKAYKTAEAVTGTIISKTKGGLIVDLFGMETFLPGSQIAVKPVTEYDKFVGKKMELKVVKVNEFIKSAIVSHKALIESDSRAQDPPQAPGTIRGNRTLHHSTPMEKLEKVNGGISKNELEKFKEDAGLDYDTLARGLSTARATLINKKGKGKFNFAVSEKIVGLADIYSYGYEVFGNKERFNQWMFRVNEAIGNHAPFDLVNSQFGQEEVKNLIGRIDYGVFS